MKRPAQIFLCYARQDAAQVSALYEKLLLAGFQPFMDTKDILPGEDGKLALINIIHEAPFFLACLSNNSIDKRSVIQEEIHEASMCGARNSIPTSISFQFILKTVLYLAPLQYPEVLDE